MNTLRTLLFMVSVLAICPAASIAAPTFPSPSAAVDDAQVAHNFPFINKGNAPITITDTKTSCGCTTAKLGKATYSPGESGQIAATFIVGDRTGEQTKHIRVHWKEGDAPEQVTTLTMKVTIPEVLRITPRFLYWRPVPGSDPKTAKTVDITIGDSQTFKITGAKSSSGDLKVEVKPTPASDDGKRYTLTVMPTTTDQPIRSVITLTTDNPAIPAAKLTLHARLVPSHVTVPPPAAEAASGTTTRANADTAQ